MKILDHYIWVILPFIKLVFSESRAVWFDDKFSRVWLYALIGHRVFNHLTAHLIEHSTAWQFAWLIVWLSNLTGLPKLTELTGWPFKLFDYNCDYLTVFDCDELLAVQSDYCNYFTVIIDKIIVRCIISLRLWQNLYICLSVLIDYLELEYQIRRTFSMFTIISLSYAGSHLTSGGFHTNWIIKLMELQLLLMLLLLLTCHYRYHFYYSYRYSYCYYFWCYHYRYCYRYSYCCCYLCRYRIVITLLSLLFSLLLLLLLIIYKLILIS